MSRGGQMESLFDRLQGIRLGDLTSTQMDAVLKDLTISPRTKEDFALTQILQDAKLAQSVRVGIPFQDKGAIQDLTLADGTPQNVQPSGETWVITGISIINDDAINAAVCTLSITDGSTVTQIDEQNVTGATTVTVSLGNVVPGPLFLTPNLYLQIKQDASSSAIRYQIAYQVVGY